VIIDAIVLAGGRATRLGGTSKPALRYGERSLLQVAIDAVSAARQIVVVGSSSEVTAAAPGADVVVTREFPAFCGPAAAIGAGLDRLAIANSAPADFTVILACDMPRVTELVASLLTALRTDSDGVVAVSPDGRTQSLAGAYSTRLLRESVAARRDASDLDGLSVRALLSALAPASLDVPVGVTDDVDTWPDAERLGVVAARPISS
jgi:molybdopterin-guanine dinucleotide biosynthesis protein A